MGKTKVNIVSGEPEVKKKKLSYEEKRASRAAEKKENQLTGELVNQKQVNELTNQPINSSSIKSPVKIERAESEKESSVSKVSKARGKRYHASKAKVEGGRVYPLSEAAKLVRETSYSKFPGTVELHLVLDKEKGSVNTRVETPHSTGSSKKIEVASEETVAKLQAGKIDFDVLIATPEMMPKLVPFAKVLGPRGLMPNPKNGTVVDNPEKALEKFSDKTVQIKTEKDFPLVHTTVAKTTQVETEIAENANTILEAVGKKSIKKAVLASTMGPGILVQVG